MSDFVDDFARHLKQFRAAPFLFVGAGLSCRYLGLDDWEALLRRLAELTGKEYDYYAASAGGDLPRTATLIAGALHDPWWSELRFEKSRSRFKGRLGRPDSALKAEASIYLGDSLKNLPRDGALADELTLLRNVVTDGVITTNFDPLLEELFPDFRVFVGQDRLLFSDVLGVGEIYKIHGSYEDPDSLVLTDSDYRRFHERNPILAAKLITIFVEHPIVFLGYSLSDPNVATILESIILCLDSKEGIEKLADRLIFIDCIEGVSPSMAPSVMRVDGKPVPVMTVRVPDFSSVFEVLGGLQRGFPARLLRQLKEQVYELVLEHDPKGRLYVAEMDDTTDLSGVEVVFGVGAISRLRDYVGLQREDLLSDVLDEGSDLNPVRVVQEALPNVLTHPGNVPIYKYLRQAGVLDDQGDLVDATTVDRKIATHVASRARRLGVTSTYSKAAAGAVRRSASLSDLAAAEEPHNVLQFIPALDETSIDPEELRRFLIKHEGLCANEFHRSQWIKMACLYDWLMFGRQSKPEPRRGRRPRRKPHTSKTSLKA